LLEIKKTSLSKASQNLINAAEQGIITEQTKLRLKQLEEQIATVNFDIDQERQKSYAYLTEDLIINYFKKAINGNIEDKEIQKHIIKTFIREIIVYNESIVILYNFAEPLPSKEYTPDNIENFDLDSIKSNLLNEEDLNNKSDLKFFTSNEYFGVLQPRE
jgi:site-specific DNA recombinase